jgi:diguanylate cyclase (GGDEF)-like protein
MPIPLTVLIVEDQAGSAALMVSSLQKAGYEPAWQRVETEADYLAHLHDQVDLILAGGAMPHFDGLRALDLIQARQLDIPVIIVAGEGDEKSSAECLQHGAAEYLAKDQLGCLGQAVTAALAQKRFHDEAQEMLAALRASEAKYRQMASTDSMTGLHNRRHFFELAEQEFERSRRYAHALSILMMDVDNLKSVNDTFGHLAGDLLIQTVAKACRQELRKVDLVGRYGGDEFVALLPETPLSKAAHGIERLHARIAQETLHFEGQAVLVSISIGAAELDESCQRLEMLLAHADQALYSAKAAGKNRVEMWKG